MEHHVAGYGPVANSWIVFKWVMIWLMACGIPIVASLALPQWVKTDNHAEHH
jgi:hypothetical protein